ncbi:MAG: Dot/Icm type IV secretion system ATPase DotB [Gammaproteobacteria bacterium]|nr:Dot/Icm type IV secretion system ATPase DotB [Gammaproteobacteria bacterium]
MNEDRAFIIPNEPVRVQTKEDIDLILAHCCDLNASDITIQTGEVIYAEIYGKLQRITNRVLSNNEVGQLLNSIYGPNGTTQLLTGIDIDTQYEFRPNRYMRFRFRVNGTACLINGHDGIQITLRSIPTDPPELKTLDLPENIIQSIKPQDGVVYVTGTTGSGKSTLLASIIRDIVEDPESNRKVLTYEAPIEFVFDNVNKPTSIVSQSEVPKHIPSFAAGVRNALRRKPRLILVGESRDSETINAVLEAALTGHPVYTTVHSNGVGETVRRLVSSFEQQERYAKSIDIIETTRLIVWQMLVPATNGQRVALREYLALDQDIRDHLLSSDVDRVADVARQIVTDRNQTIVDDAKRRYDEGLISERTLGLLEKGFST